MKYDDAANVNYDVTYEFRVRVKNCAHTSSSTPEMIVLQGAAITQTFTDFSTYDSSCTSGAVETFDLSATPFAVGDYSTNGNALTINKLSDVNAYQSGTFPATHTFGSLSESISIVVCTLSRSPLVNKFNSGAET